MKYKKHEVLEDGYTDWIKPNMSLYKASCCDCGLVHDFVFEIVEEVNSYIIFKVKRNNRATAQKRRNNKYDH